MYEPIKPWRDFADQVVLLESRGMQIDDSERAEKYLRRIGYYRLSGYFHVFRQWDGQNQVLLETFRPNSSFESVLSLYLFDKKLRLLALDALERIEMAVRVDIVHILGKKDPLAHENAACFDGKFAKTIQANGKTKYQEWYERLEELIRKARQRKTSCVVHNLHKYGHLPVWAVCGLWDFGAMSRLYEGMKHQDQNLIARKYGALHGGIFAKWLRSLNEIRNIAAHHDRLWNARIVQQAAPISTDEYWKKLKNYHPFFYFCIMQQMMKILCPHSKWADRFDELLREFPEEAVTSLAAFGLPEHYREWDLWKK
ncbi:Abi family protein [Neisseria dentiae]|uniref:Abi family protein n=1 Tax=Neisseria dentiae TaxID=194197 RepID=UPI00211C4665|nr:Abi family protein [Neisseria dentiae]MCQ9327062.1 Abi family protein [Neisseria dentiae]